MTGKALPVKTWFLISVIVAKYHASVICPEIERFKEGSDVSINCNISDRDEFDIYWYKGRMISSEPIVKLKNGRTEDVEHNKEGAYGVSRTGGLTISNFTKEYEGLYFLHVKFKNEQSVGRRIELKVKDASVICPKIERLEEGSDVSINCNISGRDEFDIYWYKGSMISSEPIVELKNWRTEDAEHNKEGAYGISSTGGLTISNLTKEHEGLYFLRVKFKNKQGIGRRIKLKVTALPSPPYPHIDSCSTFKDCNIKVGFKTNLTCRLTGIRPMLPIKWIIQNAQNANISTLPQIATHERDTDTWNVSMTLLYTALSRNSTASLQCKAEDDWNLLKYSVASALLSIENDNCSEEWTIWILPVVVVFVLGTFAICKLRGGLVAAHNDKLNSHTHKENAPSSSNEIPIRFLSLKSKVIASSSTTNHSTVSDESNASNHQTKKQKKRKIKNSKR